MKDQRKEFYKIYFETEGMPPYESLTEEQKNIFTNSFSFEWYKFGKAWEHLRLTLYSEIQKTFSFLR